MRKSIGLQDVIMTRGADGDVHLLLNRCAHRANLVCEADRGNAKSFRCPYHGWTYRNTGELIGFPFQQAYGGKGTIEGELSLAAVPRIGSHQGFVFASMAADGPSLAENETDGYHPQFVHGSIFSVTHSPIGALYSDKSTAVTREPRPRPQRERPAARVPAGGDLTDPGGQMSVIYANRSRIATRLNQLRTGGAMPSHRRLSCAG